MEYTVRLNYDRHEKEYLVVAETHYGARIEGLEKFLEEFKIPGTPVDYITRKKGVIGIEVSKILDRRKVPKYYPQTDFFIDHIKRLKGWVSEGDLDEMKKVEIGKLLTKAEEVLVG